MQIFSKLIQPRTTNPNQSTLNLEKLNVENMFFFKNWCSENVYYGQRVNPFMYNVVKWPNILEKSCGVNTARFLKYVWPFYNIMHKRVKWVWKILDTPNKTMHSGKLQVYLSMFNLLVDTRRWRVNRFLHFSVMSVL